MTTDGSEAFEIRFSGNNCDTTSHLYPVFTLPPVGRNALRVIVNRFPFEINREENEHHWFSGQNKYRHHQALVSREQKEHVPLDKSSSSLKFQLNDSLISLSSLTNAVKNDILAIRDICHPLLRNTKNHPQVHGYMKACASNILLSVIHQYGINLLKDAMEAWKQMIYVYKRRTQFIKYLKYQSLRKIQMFSFHWVAKKKAEAWIEWIDLVQFLRLQARMKLEDSSSKTISTTWRMHHARIIVRQIKAMLLIDSATKIQSFARARFAQIGRAHV